MSLTDLADLRVPDPDNYYSGSDFQERPITRNVVLFLRRSRDTLQQTGIGNRMHHRFVLVFALKTGGTVSVDGKGISLEAGHGLLILPYQFHHYLHLEDDVLQWLFITFELQQGGPLLRTLSHRRIAMDVPVDAHLEDCIRAWGRRDPAARSEVLPVLDRLLMHVLRTSAPAPLAEVQQQGTRDRWITAVEEHMIQSVSEGWTLDEVARRMGLSERHLRTRFEAVAGVSLRDYRSNYQLHQAMALLRDTALNLGEVAELCGFNSHSVFTRFITRKTGMSPRKLRAVVSNGTYAGEEDG